VRFFIRAFSQTNFTRATNKPKVLREKYAKEDQCEQVMSAVARNGTFAEVEFTASYSFRFAWHTKSAARSRITSFNRTTWTHNTPTNWTHLRMSA
jgi:hypothetical protein